MEPDTDTQVPERSERKETGSASVTECQPPSNQREEDLQDSEWHFDEHFNHRYEDFLEGCQTSKTPRVASTKDLEEDLVKLSASIRSTRKIKSSIYEYPGNTFSFVKNVYQSVKHKRRKYKNQQYAFAIIFWKRDRSRPLDVNQSCASNNTILQYKLIKVKKIDIFLRKNGSMVETCIIFLGKRICVVLRPDLNENIDSGSRGQFKLNIYHPEDFTKEIKTTISNIVIKLHLNIRPTVKVSWASSSLLKQENSFNSNKQVAFALVFLKSGKVLRHPVVAPRHLDGIMLHSEEILITKMRAFLRKYSSKVQAVFIYSTNSPCLTMCMPKLKAEAAKYYKKYNIHTYVAFRKYWGLTGPKYSAFQGTALNTALVDLYAHSLDRNGPFHLYHCQEDVC